MKNIKKEVYSGLIPFEKKWDGFYSFKIDSLIKKFQTFPPEYFEQRGENMAFKLFHEMAIRVPAYKDYLKKHRIDHNKIKKFKDLKEVPWIDKENYLKKYPLDKLSWDGKISSPIISASSGSSGVPTFWPRSNEIELETTYIYELFLKSIFEIDKYKTLLVSGFSMGIYVGGTFTLNCSMRLALKGYPFTVVTPGINQKEIIEILVKLPEFFDQVIICGYPPFVRDVVDELKEKKIKLTNKKVRFFYASEALSETLREYVYEAAGVSGQNCYDSSMNLYGTADAAIAGHETPLSTLVRELYSNDIKRSIDFFGTAYVPSINMIYPIFKYFQIINGEVVLSSFNNHVPLLKYNIHDRGRILSYNEMIQVTESFGITSKELGNKFDSRLLWRLPYVCLYGRSDNTVTIYGLNVYPEHIKAALEKREVSEICTGKFVMETNNHEGTQEQYLLIRIELKKHQKAGFIIEEKLKGVIGNTLRSLNLEYKHLSEAIKEKADVKIELRPYHDSEFFNPATKQKWVRK